jgi:MFS family permease
MIDLSPVIRNRNFRYLFLGQWVSLFGTLISITVVPYQVYLLTKSSAMVGFVSAVELVPMLIGAFLGGALADHVERKKLLMVCESLMAVGVVMLITNALLPKPYLWIIFVVSALMQAVNGFHRPAMDSLGQALLTTEEMPAAAALSSLRYGFAMLVGPSIGGFMMASWGTAAAYGVDLATFVFSMWMLSRIQIQKRVTEKKAFQLALSLKEGLQYALQRKEILGTYLIDMAAMSLAFPIALFPALLQGWNRPGRIGLLYSALSIGCVVIPLMGGWIKKVRYQGRMIVIAAAIWGLGIVGFGISQNFWVALGCLCLAGTADAVSGVFRGIIWNQTIPNQIRGRMAGLEMISYMAGPLIGNARAGWVASYTSIRFSLICGGVLCCVAVLGVGFLLPQLLRYERPK